MFKRKLFFHNADTGTGSASAGGQDTSSQTQPASTPEIDYDKTLALSKASKKLLKTPC